MTDSVTGVFEPIPRNGGFLRSPTSNYRIQRTDAFVSPQICNALHLRGGESITGIVKPGRQSPELAEVQTINDLDAGRYSELKPLDELTAIDPLAPLRFETPGGPITMRVVDLMTPIGLGQRGLIVAPPRTGKTVLLHQMAAGVAANHPDLYMMVLLIDERPEEVTEMRRAVHGEVIASSNDEDIASHVRIARLIIEKAKRMVETGRNVLILLDSLTRVGRAFNSATRGVGRTMSGGLDARALAEPKAIFGAARNVENGGSLTIIASALIDTGSRMDEVIFNEFKGTGNMEIVLNRDMANRRVFPAIDLNESGTRKEEKLLTPQALELSRKLRRKLIERDPIRAMENLLAAMQKYPTNADFIAKFDADNWR
ncbi:MAG: transcription termination factor Rho [Planctomycetes bacterium]|nr:transcription termination factor Rho [Planctomycetota bacterium]MBI3833532.1 transcription termination factor Rho [Planctomycetota bacterium]